MTQINKDRKNAKITSEFTKYILIAALIVAGYLVYYFAIKTDDAVVYKPYDPQEKFKNIKEPQFQKEGELEFISKDGKAVLKKIEIEIADHDNERMQGLMYRKSMDDGKGMLFIFPKVEPQSFWMKNTIMHLDIIYVNSQKEIEKIYKNTTPFSEASIPSEKPVLYVVEVQSGFTDKYNIKEGDKIEFTKQ